MIRREAIIQKHIRLFVRGAVAADHEFFAFDRSAPTSRFSHLYEKMRGVRKATPDTLLRVAGLPCIWCEVKRPGEKPDEDQYRMGDRLQALGDQWFWTTSVDAYREALAGIGVALRQNAAFLSLHHDGSVATEIAKAEAKAGKPPKARRKRVGKATPGQIARARRAGAWGLP